MDAIEKLMFLLLAAALVGVVVAISMLLYMFWQYSPTGTVTSISCTLALCFVAYKFIPDQ